MTRVAPVETPTAPSVGWIIGMSLWLLPVLLGGGTTTWIGFGIIGLATLKRSWIIAAAVYAAVAFVASVASDTVVGLALQIAIIAVGTVDALIANRRWLLTMWGRRERGVRMLGGGLPRVAATPAPPPPAPPAPPIPMPLTVAHPAAPPVPVAEPTHAELLEAGLLSVDHDVAPPTAPDTQWRPLSPSIAAPDTAVPSSLATASPFTNLRLTQLPISQIVLPPSEAVDPMTASLEALSAIPAIGPERAARIIAAREHLPLASLQAVADAAGLQGFELVRIRPFLRFPGT